MPSYAPLTHRDVAQIILTCAAKQGKPSFTLDELQNFLQPLRSTAILGKFEEMSRGSSQFIFPEHDRNILNEPNEIWMHMQRLLGADTNVRKLKINSEATSTFYLPAEVNELNKIVLAVSALVSFCAYKK
jgi:hypothetical protein